MNMKRYLPVLIGLVLLTTLSASTAGDPRLDRAKKLFRDGGEDTCRQASQLCLEVNSVEAAEIMLDVLDSTGMGPRLMAGHYRDIVWNSMVKLTDPYAKKRVELVLKKNRSNAWVRAWSAELLGLYGDQDFAGSLTKALNDKDSYVRAAAAEALGRLNFPQENQASKKAVQALAKLAYGKDPYGRANAFIALWKRSPEVWIGKYLLAMEGRAADKDGGVRCALLGALPELDASKVEEMSARALADEDWRVRLQAVELLAASQTKTAMDRLIDSTDDERPRVRLQAMFYLRKVSGQAHRESQGWKSWWATQREAFTFPEGDAVAPKETSEGETVAIYNGIRVDSDHIAFVIDKSAAMRDRLSSQGMTKEMFAQQQLAEVLGKLPEGLVFNVYTYQLDVQTFSEKGPAEIGEKSIEKALEFVKEQRPQASKDIWKVLEQVVSDPDIDTVYLLSSGEPDTGKYVHWNRVTAHLIDLNRFQKVTVHTIAYSDSKWNRDQMEKISEASGGEFHWFE